MRLLVPVALLWLSVLGCGEPSCVDRDEDGYGAHCSVGDDCDDADPTRNADCSGPPVDCAETPFAPGCPCLVGARNACFGGDPEQVGVGLCQSGTQYCRRGGHWSACLGGVEATFEACNELDDDCDGVIDNGVRSPCGGCDSACVGGVWGETSAPFEAQSPLAITARGELTLAARQYPADVLWVTNTGEDTVSRIDVTSAREIARYDSGGSQPSRVAIDALGDVWIANRAFEGQSTLTKIASDHSRCLDRNDNGRIDTSRGPTDVLARGTDECVVVSGAPVGDLRGVARALAVDGFEGLDEQPGRLWVGLQNEQRVLLVDDRSATLIRAVETPGFAPFDAAMDRWGALWLIDRDGRVGRLIDDGTQAPSWTVWDVPDPCWQLDALALDAEGNLTLSGFYCNQVWRFTPREQRFERVREIDSARGVATDGTRSFVVHTYGELSVLAHAPLREQAVVSLADATTTPTETVGLALDGLGALWAISTQGGLAEHGIATRWEPESEQVTAQVAVGRLPYAAGDLTGRALQFVVEGEGVASHVFEGCGTDATRWGALHIAWLPGVGSRLGVRARHAATLAAVSSATFVDLGDAPTDGSAIPLQVSAGGVVEVELTLRAGSRLGAPRVQRVGLEWSCGGPD